MSFFQLVHRLEATFAPASLVGTGARAADEIIRFRPDAALAFPSTDVTALQRIEGETPRWLIATTFLSLYGTTSPLPTFLTELILTADEDDPIRSFLDLFHHRLLSLFYRTWVKYRYLAQYQFKADDRYSARIFNLMGLDRRSLSDDGAVPPHRLLRYAGLWVNGTRSASALEALVSDYFGGIPVAVHPCALKSFPIPPDERAVLGRRHCRLGEDCSIGEAVEELNSAFLMVIGPLPYERYVRFLPEGPDAAVLRSLIRLYIGEALEVDVELRADLAHWSGSRLGSSGAAAMNRLGWDTRLADNRRDRPALSVQFSLAHLAGSATFSCS